MVHKATKIIANKLREQNLKFDIQESGDVSGVILGTVEDGIQLQYRMLSQDENNDVSIYTNEFVQYPPNKKDFGLRQINEFNKNYRFAKFVMDPDDGAVHVEYFIPMSIGDAEVGDAAVEAMIRLVQIIKDAYPQMMKSIWS